jgi:hypothetical protein
MGVSIASLLPGLPGIQSPQTKAVRVNTPSAMPSVHGTDTVHFSGRKAPTREQAMADALALAIWSEGLIQAEQYPDLTPYKAFLKFKRELNDSFLTNDDAVGPAIRVRRAVYRELVTAMATGLGVKPESIKGIEDLRTAYFNRYKRLMGEGALKTALRMPGWNERYFPLLDSHVDRHFNDALDRAFRAADPISEGLEPYSYSNGITKSLHAPLIGVLSPYTESEPAALGQMKFRLVAAATGFQVPNPALIERLAKTIERQIQRPGDDPRSNQYFSAFDSNQGIVQQALNDTLPQWFDRTVLSQNPGEAEGRSYGSDVSLMVSMLTMDTLSPKRAMAPILASKLGGLSWRALQRHIQQATPAQVIEWFDLPFDAKKPKAIKQYFDQQARAWEEQSQ